MSFGRFSKWNKCSHEIFFFCFDEKASSIIQSSPFWDRRSGPSPLTTLTIWMWLHGVASDTHSHHIHNRIINSVVFCFLLALMCWVSNCKTKIPFRWFVFLVGIEVKPIHLIMCFNLISKNIYNSRYDAIQDPIRSHTHCAVTHTHTQTHYLVLISVSTL